MVARPERLLHCIRRLASPAEADPATDAALLECFVRRRDEDAFAALLSRHGPMVLGVCRRLLGDVHDAEDATQAAFLILARRASTIHPADRLAAWLHGVARHLALKCLRSRARRRRCESRAREVPARTPDPLEALTARELLAVLDEEVQRLPEENRLPIVLCCLEGLSLEEASRRLGWTAGSVKGRLERGRARLHGRLVRRGLTLPAVLGAVEVSRGSLSAGLPALLASATVRAALAFAAGSAEVPARVATLAAGGLKGMAVARIGLTALLAAGALAAGVCGMLAGPMPKQPEPPSAPGVDPPQAQRPARTDRFGDPLPEGAIARLGTIRFRHVRGETLAFSPDGKSVRTCGGDGTIRTWDVRTGGLLHERRLPFKPVPGSSLSPDGRLLAFQVAEEQHGFSLWDVERHRLRHKLDAGTEHAHTAAFAPDGKILVTVENGGSVRAWDVATGKGRLLGRLEGGLRCVSFTASGSLMGLGDGNTLHFWDLAEGGERSLRIADFIHGAVVSPDGRVAASWTCQPKEGDAMAFWDAATGKPAAGWVAPELKHIQWVRFAPDRRTLLVGTESAMVVWDPKAGKRLHLLPAGGNSGLAFSPDGRTVAVLGGVEIPFHTFGKALRLWDLATGAPRTAETAEEGHRHEATAIAFAPDGRTVATSCPRDNCVILWETTTGRRLRSLSIPFYNQEHGLTFSADGKHLFVGTSDAILRWEVATGRETGRFPFVEDRGESFQSSLHLNRDGRTLLADRNDRIGRPDRSPFRVDAWDVATGKLRRSTPLPGETWSGTSRFSEDGRLLVRPGGIVRVAATGEELFRLSVADKAVGRLVALSADGALVAAGIGKDIAPPDFGAPVVVVSAVQVWEVATRLAVVRLETGDLGDLAFTPDGRGLITVGSDALKRWDLASAREAARRTAPAGCRTSYGPSFACSLALAPDGRTVATSQPDTTVLVWDLPPPAGSAVPLTAAQREACWADLAGDDAAAAMRALARLADAPGSVAFLRQRLRPAQPPPAEDVRPLLADLDAPEFERREAARKRLAEWGDVVHPALREALRGKPSLEVQRWLEALLADSTLVRQPEIRRHLRAVRLLASLGTPDAREVLEGLAKGMAEAHLTREAKAALERLDRRTAASP